MENKKNGNQDCLLEKIKSPSDIKRFSIRELNQLANEIREQIVRTVASNGGHLSSNLGAVELSIALHRVFNTPDDKIVWDVGHQCYAHKLLTGRLSSFGLLRKQNGLAGFPKQSENIHDAFNTGHASTSISASLGLLAAEMLKNGSSSNSRSIAVIGDGALTGGLSYEALSHAGHLGLPLIVILNDNKMSINRNVGGLSKYLSRLSMKARYQSFRRSFDSMAKKIPFVGEAFFNSIVRFKRAIKAVFYNDNFFVDLGFEYVGPIGGHNIQALIEVLTDVRKLNRPVVVHVITRKGKGFNHAENNPDNYHGVSSFSVDDGICDKNIQGKKSFTEAFSNSILEIAEKDEKVIAITAAMKSGTGLTSFAQKFPNRFFDVGIAEEHSVTFASGLASLNLKPVVAVYSTFIQRAADQIIHDAALQKLPVILALDRAGFVSADGETHQGLFDITIFRSTPNMTILAPASENELKLMMKYSLEDELTKKRAGPVIIRYPKTICPDEISSFSLPIEYGRGVWVSKNNETENTNRVCIAFTGSLYQQVKEASELLKKNGINADLYNLRFLKPVDEDYLTDVMNNYKLIIIAEEGMREGGFCEYALSLALKRGVKAKIEVIAAESSFLEEDKALGTRDELLAINGLDGSSIAKTLQDAL
ncbi:MAG: 1-deoxy-D-xylulose-5-phosphate synthase [Treponema sp.]|nr:1-deoxy-D-xylulose-5-phosphate synthase [Treponema sp.]MCL2250695.1 1-deoxy-D-xylulose-5-phosphate synthase [Treponema sp.]